jgi:hypothetical protein
MKWIWRSTIRFALFLWTVPCVCKVARKTKSQFGAVSLLFVFEDYVYIDGICESAYLREPCHHLLEVARSGINNNFYFVIVQPAGVSKGFHSPIRLLFCKVEPAWTSQCEPTHLLSNIIVPDPLCGFTVNISAICVVPVHPRSYFIFLDAGVNKLDLNICVSCKNRRRIEPLTRVHFVLHIFSVFSGPSSRRGQITSAAAANVSVLKLPRRSARDRRL